MDLKLSKGQMRITKRRFEFLVTVAILVTIGYFVTTIMLAQRETAQSVVCKQNLQLLSSALLNYSDDHDGKLPPANRWEDSIDNQKYLPNVDSASIFHCPAVITPYGYAMNAAVGGASLDSLSFDQSNTVLLFETDQNRRNANGSMAILAHVRHDDLNCSFCDGHVQWVTLYTTNMWKWSIKQ